jgi:hypothetical protein
MNHSNYHQHLVAHSPPPLLPAEVVPAYPTPESEDDKTWFWTQIRTETRHDANAEPTTLPPRRRPPHRKVPQPHLRRVLGAFIKNRNIQDNFRLVRGAAKLLHARKKPSILLKIDISKAFDSVSWPFLIDLLQFMGFPLRWTNWISMLLSTASSKVAINRQHGDHICHARGLRQGDPLSPLLFVIAMEVLNAMFNKAGKKILLSLLNLRAVPYRISLYADDVVAFRHPVAKELLVVKSILGCLEGGADSPPISPNAQ